MSEMKPVGFSESNCMVGIAFREGLSTSYGICLPVMQGMKATVGIVTDVVVTGLSGGFAGGGEKSEVSPLVYE